MQTLRMILIEMPTRVGDRVSWTAPTLARVVVGWAFVAAGWGKLTNLARVTEFFRELGIPFAEIQAPFVASTELLCGGLVLVGLFTRVAALPLIGTMVVAVATSQWAGVSTVAGLFGLVEVLYIVLFVWLAVAGGGPLSLDAAIERSGPARSPQRGPYRVTAGADPVAR